MSSLIDKIKDNKISLPIWLGQVLAYIPFSWRPVIGKEYSRYRKLIDHYNKSSEHSKEEFIFSNVSNLVNYAYNHIDFYRHYYDEKGFSPSDLHEFKDLQKIPVINKDILLKYALSERSNLNLPHYLVNTGGSSGKTLTLCSQRYQMPIETIHCHIMYSSIGYRYSDLKMSIVGRKLNSDYRYDFARHILFLNMYKPFEVTASSLGKLLKRYPIRFIQGYPSVVSDFANYCHKNSELLKIIRNKLSGIILNSEFPYDRYVENIEKTFGVKCLSFYGHTERCVLAHGDLEKKNHYYPFQTYGFTEAVQDKNGKYHLVGTSYYNFASPLIRYDTEDIISNPIYSSNGILEAFDILEGRSGQFIIDKHGRSISLTGLIMGRHHLLFNYCSHIQVAQVDKGKAIIYYILKPGITIEEPSILFDSSGIDIEFEYKMIPEPIRTKSGKVNLLVKE